MNSIAEYDDVVTDDGALLLDKIVRSLYRNKDGFLTTDAKHPHRSIDDWHNAVCLYIYTVDDGLYALNTYYVHAGDEEPHSYEEWRSIAFDAADNLNAQAKQNWHGIYGWSTTTIRITPIRNNDLFIAIDPDGVRHVRVSFNTGKTKRETQKGKKS